MATTHKLIYFNAPGRAEAARIFFDMAGVEYEDVRLTGEQFAEKKAAGEFPFGQLPVLVVGDRVIAQSVAIARYAAKLAGAYPTDPVEALKVDSIVDFTQEVTNATVRLFGMADGEEKDAYKRELIENVYPRLYAGAEKFLAAESGPFAFGAQISLADVFIAGIIQLATHMQIPGFAEFLAQFPRIQQVKQAVSEHPVVVARNNKCAVVN